MANILGRQRLERYFTGDANGPAIYHVDGDPSIGDGIIADQKSIALAPSGVYFKTGALATDWVQVASGVSGTVDEAIKKYSNFMAMTQNDDDGWDTGIDIDSSSVRDKFTVSPDTEFGQTAIALMCNYNIFENYANLDASKKTLATKYSVAVDPFNQFSHDLTEAFIRLGGFDGPLKNSDYLNKGKTAHDAVINYAKTIQRWHDLGNGPNANPPVGNGADGNLLDLWNNDNAACVAVSLSDAATRYADYIQAVINNNGLEAYDAHQVITSSNLLSSLSLTINGEDYAIFSLALANRVKDEVYPNIDQGLASVTVGEASCGIIFKTYEAELGFDVVLSAVEAKIKGDLQITGPSAGFYAVDGVSGDKRDQGMVLQFLVDLGEDALVTSLIGNLINIQDSTGHFLSFPDVTGTAQYEPEGAAQIALGMCHAIEAGLV